MDITPNLNLPYILAAQAQKHVTHNEALRILDALLQAMVLDRDLAVPPGSPGDGARYLVAPSPTGAWAGQAGRIAAWQDGAWAFYTPKEGWLVWVADEDVLLAYNGTAFVAPPLQNVAMLGIGTTADTTNRLAVSSAATLFSHAGASHQVKVNKAAAGDSASFLFQTGFSGRAEIGAIGNNDFQFKVSADGATWRVAITIGATGYVGFGTTGPDRLLHAELDDAVTNAVSTVARLTHTTSGTAAVGFGLGLEAELENAAGANKVVGTLEWVFTDATNGSEDADLVFKGMTGGVAAAELMRLTSLGYLGIGTNPSYKLDLMGRARMVFSGSALSPDANATLSLQRSNSSFNFLEILNNGGAGKGCFFGLDGNNFELWSFQGGDTVFYTGTSAGSASERVRIKGNGDVRVGSGTPSTKLDVDGPVRVKSYTVAGIPSASSHGAGALIHVTDEAGGAVLAFSDGTVWRRVTDRAAVS